MRILVVCRSRNGKIAPYIQEQVDSLITLGLQIDFFFITDNGIFAYLRSRKEFLNKMKTFKPNLIHAHYGMSGLFCNLQRRIPVVTTYLGSDINYVKVLFLSKISMMLSVHNIFVSENNRIKSGIFKKYSLVPFGIITNLFKPYNKIDARLILGLDQTKYLVLFAGSFNNPVKNVSLAKLAVSQLPGVELISLGAGYSREEVVLLMNSVDAALMTSYSEGSPQFIKEAMACNCPIVSVSVGDVHEMLSDLDGCYISQYDFLELAEKLHMILENGKRTQGRKRIIELGLDTETVARKLLDIYKSFN